MQGTINFIIIFDLGEYKEVRHKLIDVLFIAVAACLCGCNDWIGIEIWALEREYWLKKYLELQNGIPSLYSIERGFDVLNPKQFEKYLTAWIREIVNIQ